MFERRWMKLRHWCPGAAPAARTICTDSGPAIPPRAFTLIELIVVIVLLAVFAGLIAPRVLDSGSRQAEAEARDVQRLLTILAERDAVSVEPQAMEYDESDAVLRLMVMRAAVGSSSDDNAIWRPDPGVPPVYFSKSHLAQGFADGRALPRGKWRLVMASGSGGAQPRPALTLVVAAGAASASRGSLRSAEIPTWQISLATDASMASWSSAKSAAPAGLAAQSRTIDLDASGKGSKPW